MGIDFVFVVSFIFCYCVVVQGVVIFIVGNFVIVEVNFIVVYCIVGQCIGVFKGGNFVVVVVCKIICYCIVDQCIVVCRGVNFIFFGMKSILFIYGNGVIFICIVFCYGKVIEVGGGVYRQYYMVDVIVIVIQCFDIVGENGFVGVKIVVGQIEGCWVFVVGEVVVNSYVIGQQEGIVMVGCVVGIVGWMSGGVVSVDGYLDLVV